MKHEKLKLGITQGDINGIGIEVIIKSLSDSRLFDYCTPIIYGSPKAIAYHKKVLDIESFTLNNIKSVEDASPKRVNIINCGDEALKVEFGKSTEIAGQFAFKALEDAVKDWKRGAIDAIITAPINKDNIQREDFKFPGHTEYLEKRLDSGKALMLLISQDLRVGVVTGHIPISEVSANITKEKIVEKIKILNKSLLEDFGIRKPKIAVLGLNPHAGDNGLLGKEENEIIIPALKEVKLEGIKAFGPFPADGFFGSSEYNKFDAILAMYHDQGLIPFKALAFDSGVNYTAGLERVRTSPSHGTAYDLAGSNKASKESFMQAIYMAIDVVRKRKEFKQLSKNPLKHYEIDHRRDDQD
ncbi:MAG: 4-hydroxythreonine-4-phosphate dehydrogenase PdxA [Marinifilaceae bacterium]|jgi:4-hydroxythreonine-4-phosphate dehydrogenase|nr:4-hydroxythreonine-4-phosphate dehydrogenase PdxA [Marinifilaceae bacterium]